MDLELEPRSVAEIRETARNMTAIALEDAYAKAVDADTPLKAKLEFIDMAAKLADLHPKASSSTPQTAQFVIQFNNNPREQPHNVTITQVDEPASTALPPAPPFLQSAGLNADLSYAYPD